MIPLAYAASAAGYRKSLALICDHYDQLGDTLVVTPGKSDFWEQKTSDIAGFADVASQVQHSENRPMQFRSRLETRAYSRIMNAIDVMKTSVAVSKTILLAGRNHAEH